MERHNVRNIQGDISKLAGDIDKEAFLKQLKTAWAPHISKNANIDHEVKKAHDKIMRSGPFLIAFKKIGLTDDDLRQVIKEILEEKQVK